MLASSLAQLTICAPAPDVWLRERVRRPRLRWHRRTPGELRRELQALTQRDDAPTALTSESGGWVTTRVLDGQAHGPLRDDDELELGDWVIEFAFTPRSWLHALLGLPPRRGRVFRGIEARARAFVEADLREVEQWGVDGFPEVCVTLGRAGVVAVEAQRARRSAVVQA